MKIIDEKYSYIRLTQGLAKMKADAIERGDDELLQLISFFHSQIGPDMSEDQVAEIMVKAASKFCIKALIEAACEDEKGK